MNYLEFRDLGEAIETIAHEQLQYRQLDRGSIIIRLGSHESCDLSILQASVSKRVDGQGFVAPGRIFFEVCLGGDEPHLYSSQEFRSGQVYAASGGGGGHQLLKPGYLAYCVSFDEELLQKQAGCPVVFPSEGVVRDICPRRFADLVGLCREFTTERPEGRAAHELSDRLASLLLGEFLRESIPISLPSGSGSRAKLAWKIRELLECYELPLADVCAEVEMSERAMRRVFTDAYGVSPIQYRLSLRLSRVREELKHSPARKGVVAAVATRHGFWHMGRFGSQYRRQYLESPTETLRRHGAR